MFDLTVASTGINEKTAKRLKLDYDKAYTYSANHAGYYPGAVNMSIKVVYEKGTGRILGAQAVGYDGTDKRVDVLATAIRAKMTAYDLTKLELCYAPPLRLGEGPGQHGGLRDREPDEGPGQALPLARRGGTAPGRQRDAAGHPDTARIRERPHRRLHQHPAGFASRSRHE